jgi:hypothetical protein
MIMSNPHQKFYDQQAKRREINQTFLDARRVAMSLKEAAHAARGMGPETVCSCDACQVWLNTVDAATKAYNAAIAAL